ncbi:hypothetical protein D9M70_583580 [compost metagenome]
MVDVLGDHALLFRRRGDLLTGLLNLRYGAVDHRQRIASLGRCRDRALCHLAAFGHARNCLIGAFLQTPDQHLNLFGRVLGAVGKRTHFIGHHRETTPSLPRARGLDSRVQR